MDRHVMVGLRPFLIGLSLAAVLMTGCAGLEPYEPRNDRIEGPERGLVTGAAGEFVIYRDELEPEKNFRDKKSLEVPVDGNVGGQ